MVGRTCHQATQGIDLAHQVTFADAADGRITAHRAERLDTVRKQQCLDPHARRRERRLRTGMAAADYDHVVDLSMEHPKIL